MADFSSQFVEDLKSVLALILTQEACLPADWHSDATTYDLQRFDSKTAFLARFRQAVAQIINEEIHEPQTVRALLESCGLPYDYARLGHPFSCLYELFLQELSATREVISFASGHAPFLAAIEARRDPQQAVELYSSATLALSPAFRAELQAQGVALYEGRTEPLPTDAGALRIAVFDLPFENLGQSPVSPQFDALCYRMEEGGVLFLQSDRIDPDKVQILRKRTVSAALPAHCQRELQRLVGQPTPQLPVDRSEDCDALLHSLYAGSSDCAYFCTGLAAEAAVFSATAQLLKAKSAEHSASEVERCTLYYAENAYGGTVQLIGEILGGRQHVRPRPLKVLAEDEGGQTQTLIDHFIQALQAQPPEACMLFLETPTNPQLQVHDFEQLMGALRAYKAEHGITVPVLVDTTIAPLYPLFEKDFAQDWPFVIVKSGSKYFTRGKAILGVAMANAHPLAREIVARARVIGLDRDSKAKPTQIEALHRGLQDLRPRMQAIAENMSQLAAHLQSEMQARGRSLLIYTMSPQQIEAGLATGLLSFYWPAAETAEGVDLVDEFVDFMLAQAPDAVKNRVSYGQADDDADFDPTYIINPQESTQGALSAEVKEAQKRDNVQICRISVPQRCDLKRLKAALSQFVALKYGN